MSKVEIDFHKIYQAFVHDQDYKDDVQEVFFEGQNLKKHNPNRNVICDRIFGGE